MPVSKKRQNRSFPSGSNDDAVLGALYYLCCFIQRIRSTFLQHTRLLHSVGVVYRLEINTRAATLAVSMKVDCLESRTRKGDGQEVDGVDWEQLARRSGSSRVRRRAMSAVKEITSPAFHSLSW